LIVTQGVKIQTDPFTCLVVVIPNPARRRCAMAVRDLLLLFRRGTVYRARLP